MQLLDKARHLIAAAGRSVGLYTKAAVAAMTWQSVYGYVRESFPGAWQRNVTVDALGALTNFGAVYACISRIATDIAKLAPQLLTDEKDGILTVVGVSPFWGVLRKPNAYQNRIQFLMYWVTCKLMYGNAYAIKERDQRGVVVALYLLDPRRVTALVTPAGDVYYQLATDDLARVPSGKLPVPASEIIHDRGITLWHPLVGVSPIAACGASATQGIRIQTNSAVFFQNMSRPSGMLTAPGTISEPTAARLKQDWEQNFAGANLGRLAVLGDGLKYEPMTIPAEQAQLIEQLNWTVEDVARCFRVPLYKINAGPMPTAGNVEALESQYYSGCLQVEIEAIELCLTEGLSLPTGYQVELDLAGLLRMDSAGQVEMLCKAAGGAFMVPNEARSRSRMPPVAGGQQLYRQQQEHSLESLAKRDAGPDPFGTAKPPAPPPAAPPAAEPPPPADDKTMQLLLQKVLDAAERAAAAEERARVAEKSIVLTAAPSDDDAAEKMAQALIAGFDALEVHAWPT